jgi:hypothetical protein
MDVLRADAVEFPFHQPVLDRPQQRRHVRDRRLKRMREKERIGMAALAARFVVAGLDEGVEIRGPERAAGLRIAHHPLRHQPGVDACDIRQSFDHLQFGYADAQSAGDQFEERQPLFMRQSVRPLRQAFKPLEIIEAAQGEKTIGHPDVERRLLDRLGKRQKQRQRFREIADILVAFLEQPFRQLRPLERQLPQKLG